MCKTAYHTGRTRRDSLCFFFFSLTVALSTLSASAMLRRPPPLFLGRCRSRPLPFDGHPFQLRAARPLIGRRVRHGACVRRLPGRLKRQALFAKSASAMEAMDNLFLLSSLPLR
jgi:hypothetical protein